MSINKYLTSIILTFVFCGTFAQNNDTITYQLTSETPKELNEYSKIIAQANKLYAEKNYAESVIWYRKALKIKPEDKFAKFRIEDVYTLFIVNKIVKTKIDADSLVNQIELSYDAKEFEKVLATRLTQARKIFEKPKVDEIALFLEKNKTLSEKHDTFKTENNSILIAENKVKIEDNIEKKPEPEIKKENIKPVNEIKPNIEKSNVEKSEPLINKLDESTAKSAGKNEINPVVSKEVKPVINDEIKNEQIIKQLKEKYPARRTVEQIDDNNKKVTRITYNENGNITIYTKTIHSWGGIFFFLEKPPLSAQNISEEYYTRNTKE